jgi:hypothetical protein
MGLMMLFMFRGMGGDREPPSDKPSLDDLRAEHRRITSDLERRRDASHRERRVGASS